MTLYFYSTLYFLIYLSFYLSVKFSLTKSKKNFEYFISLILIIISSFRWEVGGDWFSYLNIYNRSSFNQLSFEWSYIFELINFLSKTLKIGIWGVNFFISTFMFYSINRLSKILKFDYLFILTIIFSLIYFNLLMGYVRQGFCVSILILSFCYALEDKNKISFILFMIAILTHFSVIIFLPFWIYLIKKQKLLIFFSLIFLVILISLNFPFLSTSFREFIVKSYMVSAGANFRLITLIACLLIFIILYKEVYYTKSKLNLLLLYSSFLIIFFNSIAFMVPSLGSLIDRLNVYFFIYQIIVIGKLSLFIRNNYKHLYLQSTSFISFIYFFLFLSWLLYGDYSIFWLNYKFIFNS